MKKVYVPCEVRLIGSGHFEIAYYPDLYSQRDTINDARRAGIRQWGHDDFIVAHLMVQGHTVMKVLGAFDGTGASREDYRLGIEEEYGLSNDSPNQPKP